MDLLKPPRRNLHHAHREALLLQLASAADAIAADRLGPFVRLAWRLINPGRRLVWNWHMDAICEHLEAITNGDLKKLLINIPPGYSKTTIVTICWAAWEWLRFPEMRYLFASYGDSLSRKAAADRRTVLNSDWYWRVQAHSSRVLGAPNWHLGAETQGHVNSSRGGWMLSTSVGGQGTGRHGDRNIIDDPIKAEDVYTVELENHVRWFRETLTSRVTSVTDSAFVVVMQRLHCADLSGVLRDDPDWCSLVLPAEYERAKTVVNSLGWADPRTVEGEPLFPARFPAEYLEKRKGPFGIGPIAYSAQEQQDPVAGSGNIFQRQHWRFWWAEGDKPGAPEDRLPDDVDRVIGSWDMTFKKGVGTDFVVGQIWASKGANLYLLDQTRARLGFSETEAAFVSLRRKWPMVTRWLVEEKANGAAIIDRLRTQIPGIIPINPTESKEARAAAIASFVQSGNVWLPAPSRHPWVLQLIEEAAAFPHGTYDDQVDALTQALRDLSLRRVSMFTLPRPIQGQGPKRGPGIAGLDVRGPGSESAVERDARRRVKAFEPGLRSAKQDPGRGDA